MNINIMMFDRCVDYFRIETSKIDKFGLVKDLGPHIGRNELGGVVSDYDDFGANDYDEDGHCSHQPPIVKVDLVPCTQYKFKVAAYEFFHGTGKIFPVWSKEVGKVVRMVF